MTRQKLLTVSRDRTRSDDENFRCFLCVRDSGAINKTSAVMNGGGGAYAGDGGAS